MDKHQQVHSVFLICNAILFAEFKTTSSGIFLLISAIWLVVSVMRAK